MDLIYNAQPASAIARVQAAHHHSHPLHFGYFLNAITVTVALYNTIGVTFPFLYNVYLLYF